MGRMKTEASTAFEVLDALGLAQLVKRRGDLGGSIPLRAAQGCSPLFEGNAFGFQITLRHPLTLRRGPNGVTVEMDHPYAETFAIGHRAVLRRLIAQELIAPDAPFATAFADSFIQVDAGAGRASVRLWTGLCVRADPRVWLRVSASANRRNRLIEIEDRLIPDDGAFTPLVLEIALPSHVPDHVVLDGEIATVAPVAPCVHIDEVALAQAPEIGAAHAAFYNEAYFEAKHASVTGKYRKMRPHEGTVQDAGSVRCRLVTFGPPRHAIAGPVQHVVFTNQVPFEAVYDGFSVTVEADQTTLRAGARAVERDFAEALGPTFLGEHRRAMLYFTKYFTPHPPGEPHFFIKAWALMHTPPGWSCLLEGVPGEGFDVLRGVVSTDVFHAMPAVFQIHRAGVPIRVGLGEPLLRVMPIPRSLLHAGFRPVTLRG